MNLLGRTRGAAKLSAPALSKEQKKRPPQQSDFLVIFAFVSSSEPNDAKRHTRTPLLVYEGSPTDKATLTLAIFPRSVRSFKHSSALPSPSASSPPSSSRGR
jgi:hypothetical protein